MGMGARGRPEGNGPTENQGKKKQESKKPKKAPGAIFQLFTIGTQLVAATFGGLAAGYYLDRYLGTSPWFTIALLLLGIAAGFINIYTTAKKYGGSS